MISVVIDICKNVFDMISKNEKENREKIEKIANVMEEISKVLDDTSEKLIKDEYPHNNCIIMEILSKKLHESINEYLTEDESKELENSLLEASQVEKQFALRKEPDTIPLLQKASGKFKAMSILLKLR